MLRGLLLLHDSHLKFHLLTSSNVASWLSRLILGCLRNQGLLGLNWHIGMREQNWLLLLMVLVMIVAWPTVLHVEILFHSVVNRVELIAYRRTPLHDFWGFLKLVLSDEWVIEGPIDVLSDCVRYLPSIVMIDIILPLELTWLLCDDLLHDGTLFLLVGQCYEGIHRLRRDMLWWGLLLCLLLHLLKLALDGHLVEHVLDVHLREVVLLWLVGLMALHDVIDLTFQDLGLQRILL